MNFIYPNEDDVWPDSVQVLVMDRFFQVYKIDIPTDVFVWDIEEHLSGPRITHTEAVILDDRCPDKYLNLIDTIEDVVNRKWRVNDPSWGWMLYGYKDWWRPETWDWDKWGRECRNLKRHKSRSYYGYFDWSFNTTRLREA